MIPLGGAPRSSSSRCVADDRSIRWGRCSREGGAYHGLVCEFLDLLDGAGGSLLEGDAMQLNETVSPQSSRISQFPSPGVLELGRIGR